MLKKGVSIVAVVNYINVYISKKNTRKKTVIKQNLFVCVKCLFIKLHNFYYGNICTCFPILNQIIPDLPDGNMYGKLLINLPEM